MESDDNFEEFFDCTDIRCLDEYDQNWAKEKASVLWLISKAFNGDIPGDLLEPFYRDHENARHLKPKIVHCMANAELYCLALVNIYSDPNYHNLDHQGIIQVLTRKGVCLVETRDAPLTETTLVQTAPFKINSHMSVIDGIMSLYIKEVLIPEKIFESVRKFSCVDINSEMPSNAEEAAVLWINKCCEALQKEIKFECSATQENRLPKIPSLQDISDISDGCCIAAVICYYCPTFLRWRDICWSSPLSLSDCISNLQLVKRFCTNCLQRDINFLSLEDLLYIPDSIKQNVLAFVADLLYTFVICQAPCVTQKKKSVKNSSHLPLESFLAESKNSQKAAAAAPCSPIPNLRSDSYGGSTSSLPDIRAGTRRNYGSKERLCEKVTTKKPGPDDTSNNLQRTSSVGTMNGWKSNNLPQVNPADSLGRHINAEIGRTPAEGESSTSSQQSQPSLSGAEDTAPQKSFSRTIISQNSSNFGLRKYDGQSMQNGNQDFKKNKKSLEDYYNQLAGGDGPLRSTSAVNVTDNKGWKMANGNKGPGSGPESTSSQSSGIGMSEDSKNLSSFAQLSKHKDGSSSSSINIVYMPLEKEEKPIAAGKKNEAKKTTFAALPSNTTTWQQQANSTIPQTDSGHETPTEPPDHQLNNQLCNIRLKLEERKRNIELKKKRMEIMWKKQRQKLGKAAFLQAVSKGSGSEAGTPDSGTGKEVGTEPESSIQKDAQRTKSPMPIKRMSMQEIAEDLDSVQRRWLEVVDITNEPNIEFGSELDGDNITIDLQSSIECLNSSLTDLAADISRISIQQEQVENLMKDSIDEGPRFYLHGTTNGNFEHKSPTIQWSANRTKQRDFFPPPQAQDVHTLMCNQVSEYETFTAPSTSHKEELYTRINKPDHRPKGVVSPNRQVNKANEIHVVLPQVPDQKRSDVSRKDEKHGDKDSKTKPRYAKKGTTVPNSVKHVPIEPVDDSSAFGFVIGADFVHPDPDAETEMQRKKELIMNLSIQRKAEYERKRTEKEQELLRIKEEDRRKLEYHMMKREEEKRRRENILEQYRQKKIKEDLEKDGALLPKERFAPKHRSRREAKPRPRSAYVHMNSDLSSLVSLESTANKRNSHIYADRRDFDLDSLNSGSTISSYDRHRSPSNHCHSLTRTSSQNYGEGSDASDTASNGSAPALDYSGPRLFVKPASKSNRGIIMNAINTVLAGAVNADTKRKVLEEINRSDSKHFLILFRDAGCQFRAMYSYNPEREEVLKLYGIGPKHISDSMMEKFYKYNSGAKCFSEIHTKHLTVTIDAFTISNNLWAGKKLIPAKKEPF